MRLELDGYVNPADINSAMELYGKHMFNNTRPLLVKIYALSNDGGSVGEFSGFLYSGSDDVVVTAGHTVGYNNSGKDRKFRARYDDGFEEDLVLLKCAPDNVPDIAIFRGSRRAPRTLIGMGWSTGDTVYAFGFTALYSDPGFSRGIVSSSTVGRVAINAHADNGYSGGPVLNSRGQLVGIIKGSIDATTMQVGITPAVDLHTLLLQSGQTGLQC